MARSLTSAVKSQLAGNKINPVTLVYLGIASGSRYTDHYKDISYDGNTYTASSLLLGVSDVGENNEVAVDSITVAFTGADQTIISLLLNNDYMDKEAEIYKGFLDSSQALISDPFLLFKGRIESFAIEEDVNNSQVSVSIASHWSDFEKEKGRKTNTNSQQLFFANDVGFDFSSKSVQQIKWGRS
jgi:hypothetical protein